MTTFVRDLLFGCLVTGGRRLKKALGIEDDDPRLSLEARNERTEKRLRISDYLFIVAGVFAAASISAGLRNSGSSTHLGKFWFGVFVVSNVVAIASSLSAAFTYLMLIPYRLAWDGVSDEQHLKCVERRFGRMFVLMQIAVIGMVLFFVVGVCLVLTTKLAIAGFLLSFAIIAFSFPFKLF